jgi:hypothetical protein
MVTCCEEPFREGDRGRHDDWKVLHLTRFVHGTFHRDVPPTFGAAFFAKVITTSKGTVRLGL